MATTVITPVAAIAADSHQTAVRVSYFMKLKRMLGQKVVVPVKQLAARTSSTSRTMLSSIPSKVVEVGQKAATVARAVAVPLALGTRTGRRIVGGIVSRVGRVAGWLLRKAAGLVHSTINVVGNLAADVVSVVSQKAAEKIEGGVASFSAWREDVARHVAGYVSMGSTYASSVWNAESTHRAFAGTATGVAAAMWFRILAPAAFASTAAVLPFGLGGALSFATTAFGGGWMLAAVFPFALAANLIRDLVYSRPAEAELEETEVEEVLVQAEPGDDSNVVVLAERSAPAVEPVVVEPVVVEEVASAAATAEPVVEEAAPAAPETIELDGEDLDKAIAEVEGEVSRHHGSSPNKPRPSRPARRR